MFRQQGWNRET